MIRKPFKQFKPLVPLIQIPVFNTPMKYQKLILINNKTLCVDKTDKMHPKLSKINKQFPDLLIKAPSGRDDIFTIPRNKTKFFK